MVRVAMCCPAGDWKLPRMKILHFCGHLYQGCPLDKVLPSQPVAMAIMVLPFTAPKSLNCLSQHFLFRRTVILIEPMICGPAGTKLRQCLFIRCGTQGSGLVDKVGMSQRLDVMILEVFSNLNDSVILH